MEKTEFGMEQGSVKNSPMLEISYNTVKKDGSFGGHENVNEDMEDCWFVNYDGFCCIIDSAGRVIQLGAVDIRQADLISLPTWCQPHTNIRIARICVSLTHSTTW